MYSAYEQKKSGVRVTFACSRAACIWSYSHVIAVLEHGARLSAAVCFGLETGKLYAGGGESLCKGAGILPRHLLRKTAKTLQRNWLSLAA